MKRREKSNWYRVLLIFLNNDKQIRAKHQGEIGGLKEEYEGLVHKKNELEAEFKRVNENKEKMEVNESFKICYLY